MHVPRHTRRAVYSTWCLCVLDADWCLQSAVTPDSRLWAWPGSTTHHPPPTTLTSTTHHPHTYHTPSHPPHTTLTPSYPPQFAGPNSRLQSKCITAFLRDGCFHSIQKSVARSNLLGKVQYLIKVNKFVLGENGKTEREKGKKSSCLSQFSAGNGRARQIVAKQLQ